MDANVVVAPKGRVDSVTAPEFLAAVNAASATGVTGLVLDFADVSYISSAGLRVILIAAKTMAARGGKVALCSLGVQVASVIDLSDFQSLPNLTIHDGRAAARLALD